MRVSLVWILLVVAIPAFGQAHARSGGSASQAAGSERSAAHRQPSPELTVGSLSTRGLNLERDLTKIYVGDFAHVRLARSSAELSQVFGSYLNAYGAQCDRYLPADKVEMTKQECARETYRVNNWGTQIGPSTCVEYRTVGTGLYADRALLAASDKTGAAAASKVMGSMLNTLTDKSSNPFATAMQLSDALASVGSDMSSLVTMNACTSGGLMRFQENLRRFALEEEPIRLAGYDVAQASPAPRSANYAKLIDDLIAENSRTWMMNRYLAGSAAGARVVASDADGRPAKVVANYAYSGMSGKASGGVILTFTDGLPECLYYSDNAATCRTPSPRIVAAYEKNEYAVAGGGRPVAAAAEIGAQAEPSAAPAAFRPAAPARSIPASPTPARVQAASPEVRDLSWVASDRETLARSLAGDPARLNDVLKAINLVVQSKADSRSPLRAQAEDLIAEPTTYYEAACSRTRDGDFCTSAAILTSFHAKFTRGYGGATP